MANAAQSNPQNASIALPFRAPSLFPIHSAEDSSDEFRSVIDDLTIENKKLRKKLRKYENLHDTHLQADKLFEIRIHKLPAEKRRELEETLQKFASSLDAPPNSKQSGNTKRFAAKLQTASSLANTDSAYASMSGQNQSLQSGQGNNGRSVPQPGMSQEQQQTIQSYLHEIPAGLFPQHQAVMSEKMRRKLVVRRMEQIFAGKGARDSGHQQPIQQQEVSKSAAHADRVDQGREGREHEGEGAREARIVPISAHHGESKTPQTRVEQDVEESMDVVRRDLNEDDDGEESPDQRPTRPLDLDPHRAQVPSDNIKYMRHLGFSPPEAGATANLVDDHGWVYLNVLTNMAQLHTINVTVDFVKRSIAKYSDKLDLSPDGRKVRWKGGASLTRTSSDGSPDDAARGSTAAAGNHMRNARAQPGMLTKSAIRRTVNKLAYIPLFFRQDLSDESEEDESAEWTSPTRVNADEPTGIESEAHLNSPRRRRGDDGPIIFYKEARFFTDLSGDNQEREADLGDVRHYSTNRLRPVGLSRSISLDEDQCMEKKGPLSKEGFILTEAMDTDQSSDVVTGLSRPASSRTSSSEEVPQSPIDFEVSGIGGVHPSDNFAINIRSRKRLATEGSLPTIPESKNKHYTSRIQTILAETHLEPSKSKQAHRRPIVDEIIKSERKNLPSSKLPNPSFYHFDGDGEDSEDSLYDSDSESNFSNVSSTAQETSHLAVPVSAPRLMNWTSTDLQAHSPAASLSSNASQDGIEDESMDGDDSDDGSMDMLAQAREIDPNLIRAKEREYDGGIADRLAEEIPAGSSAATAGGGSGFNSPQLYHAGKKVPNLKRAREGDSSGDRVRTKSPKVEGHAVR